MAIQGSFPNEYPSLMLDFANTKKLDPRITFTRASTATYYDGVTTALAEQNLLTYSEQFDIGFVYKNESTITVNSLISPDGTTTADTCTATGTNAFIERLFISTAGVTYTTSVYVKEGNISTFDLSNVNQGVVQYTTRFTLTGSGSYIIIEGSPTATITSVGNGWYRCTMTKLHTLGNTNDLIRIYPGIKSGTTNGNFVYLWGIQLEQRSSATAYTVTTTQPITNYIPVLRTAQAGQARFDHNPTTDDSLGLLIEEQRTNLVTYSEAFNAGGWVLNAGTLTQSSTTSPAGTLTAVKYTPPAVSAPNALYFGLTTTAQSYTNTVYAKAAGYNFLGLGFGAGASADGAYFDLSNGTTGTIAAGTTATITPVGNGWYKCSVTKTLAAGTQYAQIEPKSANGQGSSWTGNGFSGIYIWGAQLEVGPFPTSYIPTVASQVTRSADAATMTGTNFSSWYNQAEGSLYGEAVQNATNTTLSNVASLRNSNIAGNNSRVLFYFNNTARSIQLTAYDPAGNIVTDISGNSPLLSQGVFKKFVFALKTNDFAQASDGGTVQTDTSGNIATPNIFGIGFDLITNQRLNGTIKKLAYYPYRLTNAELQAITS